MWISNNFCIDPPTIVTNLPGQTEPELISTIPALFSISSVTTIPLDTFFTSTNPIEFIISHPLSFNNNKSVCDCLNLAVNACVHCCTKVLVCCLSNNVTNFNCIADLYSSTCRLTNVLFKFNINFVWSKVYILSFNVCFNILSYSQSVNQNRRRYKS